MNIVYIRTSTHDQHPENQLKDCLSINKWGEYSVYDEELSAWKDDFKREQFGAITDLIKKRKVTHLIVWDLDRLYRNRKKLIGFFQLCKVYKCKVHSFRQQWLEDINKMPEPWNEMMFDLMLQVMGWIAEDESNKKSERITDTKITYCYGNYDTTKCPEWSNYNHKQKSDKLQHNHKEKISEDCYHDP